MNWTKQTSSCSSHGCQPAEPESPGTVFPNEPARHKLLDIIRDMSLIGKLIKEDLSPHVRGHKINNQLARLIRKEIKSKTRYRFTIPTSNR